MNLWTQYCRKQASSDYRKQMFAWNTLYRMLELKTKKE